ncbi:hypothetical protein ACLK1T_01145 [Escherichia coli]
MQIVDNVRHCCHAGCGVTPYPAYKTVQNSIYCNLLVGLISIAHQASFSFVISINHRVTGGDGFLTSYKQKCISH